MDLNFLKKFKNIKFGGRKKLIPALREEDVLVWIFILSCFIFIIILILDGYLFYQTSSQEANNTEIPQKTNTITSSNIEKIIQILNTREQQFEEILKGTNTQTH